jgi:hypothetical protein
MAPTTGRSGAAVDINSVIAGMVDRGIWQYYDNLITAAGTLMLSQYTLFSYQLGTNDPITGVTKTLINTNMSNPKQFPPPRCLVLMSMGFYFRGMSLADIDLILNNYYYEFFIDDKKFFEGILEFQPSGLGVFGASAISGDAAWQNGFPAVQARRNFGRYSKYIAPLQQFTAKLTCGYSTPPTLTTTGDGGKGLNLYWILDGLTDRSVQ